VTYSLVEVSDAPLGLVELKVRDSRGVRIGFMQVSQADLDDELVDALIDWQARHSHGGRLSIIPASVSSQTA